MASAFKFDVVGWVDAAAIVTLSNINFFFAVGSLDVDVGACVTVIRVAVTGRRQLVYIRKIQRNVFVTHTVPWRLLLQYDRGGDGLGDGDLPLRKQ